MVDIPNLVIIGAQKAGTTSLSAALAKHPDVFMSNPMKEPTYFFPETALIQRMKRYDVTTVATRAEVLAKVMKRGYSNERYFCEASTDYTIGQVAQKYDIPQRMKQESPDMRLLYIVRNPFERLMSNFRHIAKQTHTTSLIALLEDPKLGENMILTSCYGRQLAWYFKHFDSATVHILFFEEFTRDQNTELRKVYDFLDLPTPSQDIEPVFENKSPKIEVDESMRISTQVYDRVMNDIEFFKVFSGECGEKWDLSAETWCR